MKKKLLAGWAVGVMMLGMAGVANATMIFSGNDYSCGWENYASDITNTNSFELGVNLAVFAGSSASMSIGQLNYGGDWATDYPNDLNNLKTKINQQLPSANVTVGTAMFSDLAAWDLLVMAGHNSFSVPDADRILLKTYLDQGGVLFVDDCAWTDGSPFEVSFDSLIFAMYGIISDDMTILPATHQIYSSHYTLDGDNFSYTYAGNGTEWRQLPLRGYENHPEENYDPVPEPATMLLMGTGLAGLIGARRKKKS